MISYLVGLAFTLSFGSLVEIERHDAHRLDTQTQAEQLAVKLAQAAEARTQKTVRYDGRYMRIDYPNGDVPDHIGVCTDLVVRSYRMVGVDLQQAIHEDMKRFFTAYPSRRIWGLAKPDSNIDHRRVPNMEVFFARHGESLPVSRDISRYQSGDIVTWRLAGNLPHVGIISAKRDASGTPLIVHNIGRGPKIENVLFAYPIVGHYRYRPKLSENTLDS